MQQTTALHAQGFARGAQAGVIETDIPARLDRLPFGRFHVLVVVALGITWILDGLEVTLAGTIAGALKQSPTLHFTNSEIGLTGSAYLLGAVVGSLFFGWLTDRLGRKKLFFITLALYIAATAATAFSWSLWSFVLFRFLTGAGIGGEYSAINSTIQELIPARVRGWSDLLINGSFWIGAAVGALGTVYLLDPATLSGDYGWRAAFLIGSALALVILLLRTWLPESPRWLMTHGRAQEAEAIVASIEDRFRREGYALPAEPLPSVRLRTRHSTPWSEVFRTIAQYRDRAAVGLTLMVAQAFFYNAVFFTYALILMDFYGVPADGVGWYILPFAAGNVLGPILLGHFFDTVGRKPMICFTYVTSGVLLIVNGYLFSRGVFDARTQTLAWSAIFFFASAAASSAYLTVSENFPLEIRALAIALFYALGTGIGGVLGPVVFGRLLDTHSRDAVFGGYVAGAALMIVAGFVALRWGVAAERKSLESVARPLAFTQ